MKPPLNLSLVLALALVSGSVWAMDQETRVIQVHESLVTITEIQGAVGTLQCPMVPNSLSGLSEQMGMWQDQECGNHASWKIAPFCSKEIQNGKPGVTTAQQWATLPE